MSPSIRPKTQKVGSSDIFQTPPSALFPLIPFLHPRWRIWEPACGEGQLLDWLGYMEGFSVVGTDKAGWGGLDFLIGECSGPWHCIVTNPPFSLKHQFIRRCYELGKPWALLLPYTAFETRATQKLFNHHGVEVLYLRSRPKFTTPSGKIGGSWFPVAWFTWGILPKPIMFEEDL